MNVRDIAFYSTALLCGVTLTNAYADDNTAAAQDTFTVGLAAQNTPRYSGSDERRWTLLPLVQARSGAFFIDTQKGVGYDLQTSSGIYFEHVLGYAFGRDDKNSAWRDGADNLNGMGSIKGAVNTSMALGWQFSPWISVEAKAILPLTDSQGVQYQPSVTGVLFQNTSDLLALQATTLFGDARNNQIFYGVNAKQSQESGYRQYQAAGGLYGGLLSLSWSHQYTRQWGLGINAEYTRLSDKVAESPIIQRQDEVDTTLAINYTF